MKFDYVVGNPPYQDETVGDQKTFAPPIYDKFIDESYKIADRVLLIHPARFLFNAGSTAKAWNQKMLADPHLKVLWHEQNSAKVFPNTDIKGGVTVTYRDANRVFGPIVTYSSFPELNSILQKVLVRDEGVSLMSITYNQNKFLLDILYADFPNYRNVIGSDGCDKRFRNNIFDKIPLFTKESHNPDDLKILGIVGNKRVWRYFPKKYVDAHENLYCWKVLVPSANGSGAIGEVLSTPLIGEPLIGEPLIGYTQSFIGIGSFKTQGEAESCMKYVKSKFARTMLGILKITQHNPPEKWRYVPMQNFTPGSDIDWSKPIPEIDRQLYAKYGLSDNEVEFIETHVKEMN